MPYSTQADLEKWLQINVTADPDPVVSFLLDLAAGEIESEVGRSLLEQTPIVEYHDGIGDPAIFLENRPVTAIASVVEDGATLTVDDDYVWYPDGRIFRGTKDYGIPWRGGLRGVVVTYTAGYSTVPDDLRKVSTRVVGRWFQASAAYAAAPTSAAGVKSISLSGSDSIEYADEIRDIARNTPGLDDADRRILSRYRGIL